MKIDLRTLSFSWCLCPVFYGSFCGPCNVESIYERLPIAKSGHKSNNYPPPPEIDATRNKRLGWSIMVSGLASSVRAAAESATFDLAGHDVSSLRQNNMILFNTAPTPGLKTSLKFGLISNTKGRVHPIRGKGCVLRAVPPRSDDSHHFRCRGGEIIET